MCGEINWLHRRETRLQAESKVRGKERHGKGMFRSTKFLESETFRKLLTSSFLPREGEPYEYMSPNGYKVVDRRASSGMTDNVEETVRQETPEKKGFWQTVKRWLDGE